jgi:putative ABC transport system permease protein
MTGGAAVLNNNGKVIRRLTLRSFKAHKARNAFVIAAVALTTILITAVFSIGMSYTESYALQQMRFHGMAADAGVNHPLPEEIERIKQLDYVEYVGLETRVGYIEGATTFFQYFDEIHWEHFRLPAVTDFVGERPVKYNEIMAPVGTLKRLGIENPVIGMEIPLEYTYGGAPGGEVLRETFVLSAYYTSYVSTALKEWDYAAVSEEFLLASGKTVEEECAVSVIYKGSADAEAMTVKLKLDAALPDTRLTMTYPAASGGVDATVQLVMLALLIMLAGYLLIYNVLYISVSNDIRFFGLLKAVGTTPSQIKKIVTRQAVILSIVGIPIGLAAGALLSFALVPLTLSILNVNSAAVISFNPLIFIGASLFGFITTLVSTLRPASRAAKISPIEALRHTEAKIRGKKRKSTAGGKLQVMAWRNVFRDRKRAIIVLVSLFLGITVFTSVSNILDAFSFDNYAAQFMPYDFELSDRYTNAWKEGADFYDGFIAQINAMPDITDVTVYKKAEIFAEYTDALASQPDDYIASYTHGTPYTREDIMAYFQGLAMSAEGQVLVDSSGISLDTEAFERGEFALMISNYPDHFPDLEYIDFTTGIDSGERIRVPIGGFAPNPFVTGMHGNGGPSIYVSRALMEKIAPEASVSGVNFNADDQREADVLKTVQGFVDSIPEVRITSKLQMQEDMQVFKNVGMILGNGLSVILFMIGLMNFVNIMATSVMARRREFAALESIGMTKGQTEKLLRYEGLCYALLSIGLIITLGSAVNYAAFTFIQSSVKFIIYSFPFIQVGGAAVLILAVCGLTPSFVFRSAAREGVIERLRAAE